MSYTLRIWSSIASGYKTNTLARKFTTEKKQVPLNEREQETLLSPKHDGNTNIGYRICHPEKENVLLALVVWLENILASSLVCHNFWQTAIYP